MSLLNYNCSVSKAIPRYRHFKSAWYEHFNFLATNGYRQWFWTRHITYLPILSNRQISLLYSKSNIADIEIKMQRRHSATLVEQICTYKSIYLTYQPEIEINDSGEILKRIIWNEREKKNNLGWKEEEDDWWYSLV